jgi:hypothetical protein
MKNHGGPGVFYSFDPSIGAKGDKELEAFND